MLVSGCIRAPVATKPSIDSIERARYAADTTNNGFGIGALRQRVFDTYDAQGLLVFSEYRDADDQIQMRFVSTVEDGVRTRTDWRREDGSLALYVLYTYDEQGRVIESRQYAPDGSLRRGFKSEWSDDGLRRERGPLPEEGGQFAPNSFFQLNALGEDLELLEFPDVDSLRTVFTYDYPERDIHGNWTLRRTRRDGVPSQIESRIILYRDSP